MRVATATLRVLVEVGCVVGGEAGCIVGPFELGFCGTSTGSVRRVGAAYVTFRPFAGWSDDLRGAVAAPAGAGLDVAILLCGTSRRRRPPCVPDPSITSSPSSGEDSSVMGSRAP